MGLTMDEKRASKGGKWQRDMRGIGRRRRAKYWMNSSRLQGTLGGMLSCIIKELGQEADIKGKGWKEGNLK